MGWKLYKKIKLAGSLPAETLQNRANLKLNSYFGERFGFSRMVQSKFSPNFWVSWIPCLSKVAPPGQPVQVMVNYQGKNRASRLSPVIIALLSAEPVRYRCPGSVHSGTLLPVNIDTNSKNGKLPNGNVYWCLQLRAQKLEWPELEGIVFVTIFRHAQSAKQRRSPSTPLFELEICRNGLPQFFGQGWRRGTFHNHATTSVQIMCIIIDYMCSLKSVHVFAGNTLWNCP